MSRYKKLLGYTFFSAVLGCFFLYIFFPFETLRQFLEGSITKISPELSLKVDSLRPALPFGLKLVNTELRHDSEPQIPFFETDVALLVPSIQTIIQRKPIIEFACKAYGGKLHGTFTSKTFGLKGPFESDIFITDMRLELYPMLKEKLKRKCSGVMSGAITCKFGQEGLLEGSGKASFSVINGKIHFIQPFLGMEAVDFKRIDANIKLINRTIFLDELNFAGKQFEATGNGTVLLNRYFERSGLNITVQIKPLSDFLGANNGIFDAAQLFINKLKKDRFSLKIHGTISQPRIKFI